MQNQDQKSQKFFLKTCVFLQIFFTAHLEATTPTYYQDVLIHNKVIFEGESPCSNRYELIKPIFDQFSDRFTVLDLGAAQGYFSFKIAQDYPLSSCIMIESNQINGFENSSNILQGLCLFNSSLKNIYLLDKKITLQDLYFLNSQEHFDVILAFLVIHMLDPLQKEKIKIIDALMSLGTNVIIEVANDVDPIHSTYIEYLSTKLDCEYLGQINRNKHKNPSSIGKLYWFRNKRENDPSSCPLPPIKSMTYKQLNGIYPTHFCDKN